MNSEQLIPPPAHHRMKLVMKKEVEHQATTDLSAKDGDREAGSAALPPPPCRSSHQMTRR
jgi:hypothetical protein